MPRRPMPPRSGSSVNGVWASKISRRMKRVEQVDVTLFSEIKFVDVSATSKGKGYAGVMKRHGFGGFPVRTVPNASTVPPVQSPASASDRGHGGNLKKGKRMAGRMGGERVTTKNHKLISIDTEKNLLVVKGAVPGPVGWLCGDPQFKGPSAEVMKRER